MSVLVLADAEDGAAAGAAVVAAAGAAVVAAAGAEVVAAAAGAAVVAAAGEIAAIDCVARREEGLTGADSGAELCCSFLIASTTRLCSVCVFIEFAMDSTAKTATNAATSGSDAQMMAVELSRGIYFSRQL